MFDEDFSCFSGEFADLDGDGEVCMDEYLNEEDDYNRIMGSKDDDNDFDCDADEDYDDGEYNGDCNDSPVSFSDSSHRSGKNGQKRRKPGMTETERKYHDSSSYPEYRIGDAIFDRFRIIRRNFNRNEARNFYVIIDKIYQSDKNSGLQILIWLTENFPNVMKTDDLRTQGIISSMIEYDRDSNDDFILKYIYDHPDFEKKVLGKQYAELYIGILWYASNYTVYLARRKDTKRIISSYYTVLNNPYINKKEYPKEKHLENVLDYLCSCGLYNIDRKLYDFFKKEIESLEKPLRIDFLMKKLDSEEFGRPIFCKTYDGVMEDLFDDDEPDEECDQAVSDGEENTSDGGEPQKSDREDRYLEILKKVEDLENKLEKAMEKIALLELLLGANEDNDSSAAKIIKPQPLTKPEGKNDHFECSLDIAGVQYADTYAVSNISVGGTVLFLPEPENKYDENAVAVLDNKGHKLGYVPKWANRQLLKDIGSADVYGIVNRVEPDKRFISIDLWIKAED